MKSILIAVIAVLPVLAVPGSSQANPKKDTDLCFVDVHTNLYGNPAVPCEYRFTMTVNPNGTITSSGGGTRECGTAGIFSLGAGTGTVNSPSSIDFPFIADITFNLPAEHQEGQWLEGLVLTLSDRGGSSPVTSSLLICSDAPH